MSRAANAAWCGAGTKTGSRPRGRCHGGARTASAGWSDSWIASNRDAAMVTGRRAVAIGPRVRSLDTPRGVAGSPRLGRARLFGAEAPRGTRRPGSACRATSPQRPERTVRSSHGTDTAVEVDPRRRGRCDRRHRRPHAVHRESHGLPSGRGSPRPSLGGGGFPTCVSGCRDSDWGCAGMAGPRAPRDSAKRHPISTKRSGTHSAPSNSSHHTSTDGPLEHSARVGPRQPPRGADGRLPTTAERPQGDRPMRSPRITETERRSRPQQAPAPGR